MNKRIEIVLLALILVAGAALRFSHFDLLEFKADEAVAANLALEFVRGGALPAGGLMSSVGVTNPPLLIYLLIPIFFFTSNVAAVSGVIALLGLGAVVATWWMGRKYYGPVTGLVAAALFAASPWAVILSRKIWAQDFVPLFAVGTMWAVHAVVVGRKPKAVFWAVLLPLATIQLHFSGFALTAAVVVILAWLRPKMDWRLAVAGGVVAMALAVPYLREQSRQEWTEYKTMLAQRSGRNWNIPPGMTINPQSGYPLPRRPSEAWMHAVAIQNAGEIEDVLGLSAGAEFDRAGIWASKPGRTYFRSVSDGVLVVQRLVFVGVLVWLAMMAGRSVRAVFNRDPAVRSRIQSAPTGVAWILVAWCVVPVVVFAGAGLWTYLSYYAILFPVHFLAVGMAAEQMARRFKPAVMVAVGVLVAANVWFMADCYRFLSRYGGAQGTYGTGLGYKVAAARYLARKADVLELVRQQRMGQMDQLGRLEMPQLDLPWLAGQLGTGAELRTNTMVIVVDENRANYDPLQVAQLANLPHTNFGPMRLYFMERP